MGLKRFITASRIVSPVTACYTTVRADIHI